MQFGDRYDAAIETELNKYHKNVVKFLKEVEQGQESAQYNSKAAKEFYASSAADLTNLVLRAEAASTSTTCSISRFPVLGDLLQAASDASSGPQTGVLDIADADISLNSGSCTVVALKVVQANHNRLEGMHKRVGRLDPYRANLAASLISDSVRIALVIEGTKKP